MRVLIASHYASESLGGEAAIPLRLFDRLTARGVDAWLATHDSDATELRDRFGAGSDRLVLTPSLPGMTPVFRWGEKLPDGPRNLAWALTQLERQYALRGVVRRLVRELGIDVVHQPIGIAPGIPSPLTDLGAPLVVGPLNGGVSMPPAFRDRESAAARAVQRARAPIGLLGHHIVRGKLDAAAVLVANEHTRARLPKRLAERAQVMPESAVVAADWPMKDYGAPASGPTTFVYVGRLVPYKGPDLLIEAFAQVAQRIDAKLDVVGDGPLRARLEAEVGRRGLSDRVRFLGWQARPETAQVLQRADVYVLPSLREPGGTTVLEAMATGLPCVVADWGGPAEYVDDGVGIRVPVDSAEGFVPAVAGAMVELAGDPARRARLGAAARAKVTAQYDWDVLTDRLLRLYENVMSGRLPAA